MRVCVDPGHGYSNATAGVHDPGAVSGGVRESVVNLAYAHELESALVAAKHEVLLTRRDESTPMPVWKRAAKAQIWKADVLLSLHCNAGPSTATGVEIQYRDDEDRKLADLMLPYLLRASGLRDHGNDQRVGLSVLQFVGPAVLIELGFLTNPGDRSVLLDPAKRTAICLAIVEALAAWEASKSPVPARPVRATCPTCGAVKER